MMQGEHELELLHSGQVEMTSTKEGHVTKEGPCTLCTGSTNMEGKIVSDGMAFGKTTINQTSR